MFKKLFKNKPIGFYFSLAASAICLFLTIFYAVYMGKHKLFGGVEFAMYLLAFLAPLVYFFVKENVFTRFIPVAQAAFLALAIGISANSYGVLLAYWLTGSDSLSGTTASGAVLMFILIASIVAMVVSIVACFMRQTKPLTAEQQAEVDASWTDFKSNTKTFAVKHKKPLIAGGAGLVALIAFIIVLVVVIIPAALFIHVDGIKLDQTDVVLYETETMKLNASVAPDDAQNPEIEFSSSNEQVVTVSESGLLKAVGIGTATVTVTAEDGGYTDECEVEVKELTVTSTAIAELPSTVHYVRGEEFSPSGISIVATLTNGDTEKITARQHKLTYDVTTVDEKTVPVTATYEYRGKTFEVSFEVYGDVAEVATFAEFNEAYDKADDYGYIRCTEDLVFDTLTFNRDITVEGVISANSVVVENDAKVVIDGRINDFTDKQGTVALTLSGKGSINIQTAYGTEQDGQDGPMESDVAGVWATNGLNIQGVALTTTGIHVNSGNLVINGGADVTVNGPGYVKRETYNGVDVYYGSVTVDGEGTSFAIYNAGANYVNRAALECTALLVDNGAQFIIDRTEDATSHYGFAIYSGTNACTVTVRNGSSAKISATELGATNNQCLSGVSKLNVLDGSSLELNAVRYFSMAVGGTIESDCNVTVNGVKFDMSKPLNERVFGEMSMTNFSVSDDPSATYTAGETFNGEGILIEAIFGISSNANQLWLMLDSGFEVEPVELVSGWNTVKVTVLGQVYEHSIFAGFGEAGTATVSTAEEFRQALANTAIEYIIVSGELDLGELTIARDIWIEGNIKVTALTVNEGVTLTTLGRIWSDGDMTISGGGKVVATSYAPESGKFTRPEYAAIRTNGALTITGVTVESNYLATGGSLTITGGANVTVYGKNDQGDGKGVNGIHASGQKITISGADTVVNIVYNASEMTYYPAAIEAGSVLVDGATLKVGNSSGASWAFGIWFEGGDGKMEVTNGAQTTLDVDPGNYSVFGGNNVAIHVTEGTSATGKATNFTVITPEDKFQKDFVKEGEVNWLTPEEADAQ